MTRPTSVTVFGILNIVLGVLALLTTFFRIYLMLRGAHSAEMTLHPYHVLWTKVALALRFPASLAMIASGFGLLYLKPWGRNISIGYAIYGIAVGVIAIFTYWTFVMPSMRELTTSGHADAFTTTTASYGGLFGCFLGPIYPTLLLVFAFTRRFAAAFRRPTPPPPMPSV